MPCSGPLPPLHVSCSPQATSLATRAETASFSGHYTHECSHIVSLYTHLGALPHSDSQLLARWCPHALQWSWWTAQNSNQIQAEIRIQIRAQTLCCSGPGGRPISARSHATGRCAGPMRMAGTSLLCRTELPPSTSASPGTQPRARTLRCSATAQVRTSFDKYVCLVTKSGETLRDFALVAMGKFRQACRGYSTALRDRFAFRTPTQLSCAVDFSCSGEIWPCNRDMVPRGLCHLRLRGEWRNAALCYAVSHRYVLQCLSS